MCLVSLQEEIRTQTHRRMTVGTQGEDGCPHATERGLRTNQPANTLISDLQPPGLRMGKHMSAV